MISAGRCFLSCELTLTALRVFRVQGMVVPEQLRQQRMPSPQAAKEIRALCENRNVAIKTVRMSSLRSICELQKRLKPKGDEVRAQQLQGWRCSCCLAVHGLTCCAANRCMSLTPTETLVRWWPA